MTYNIVFDKRAEKFLLTQPKKQQERLLSAIMNLPYTGDIKMLRGYSKKSFRLRVGSYRIIYQVKEEILTIVVININTRGDIYK